SGVRFKLANEIWHAAFAWFPTCFVQLPCSPANIVPAAKSPAVTNAMSLVIVGRLDILLGFSFKILERDRYSAGLTADLSSAKGASFIASLGQRPQGKWQIQILSAEGATHQRVESRFQRSFAVQPEELGRCPRF